MNQHQRSNTFMRKLEGLFDDPEAQEILAESMDLSRFKGRYAALPDKLKVPVTVGHVLLFTGLIMDEIEEVLAEIKKIEVATKVGR